MLRSATTKSILTFAFAILVGVASLRAESSIASVRITLGPDENVCGITGPGVKAEPMGAPSPANPSNGPKASDAAKKSTKKMGLIVWLHGGMRSQNKEKGAEAHRAWIPYVDPKTYYLCSPSAFSGQDWLTPQGQGHIDALIDYMVSHYPIDVRNINLVCVSDGCLGAILYSLQGKYDIRHRVLISSFPQLVQPPDVLLAQPRFKTGTWDFLQGGQDRLFPAQQVVPFLQQWEKTYSNSHLHYFPDGEHDFSFYVQKAPELLKSLFSGEKSGSGQSSKTPRSTRLQRSP